MVNCGNEILNAIWTTSKDHDKVVEVNFAYRRGLVAIESGSTATSCEHFVLYDENCNEIVKVPDSLDLDCIVEILEYALCKCKS